VGGVGRSLLGQIYRTFVARLIQAWTLSYINGLVSRDRRPQTKVLGWWKGVRDGRAAPAMVDGQSRNAITPPVTDMVWRFFPRQLTKSCSQRQPGVRVIAPGPPIRISVHTVESSFVVHHKSGPHHHHTRIGDDHLPRCSLLRSDGGFEFAFVLRRRRIERLG
jgi:hypothetical protein